jgi:F-type H+-transporting ATPase subunit gamma
VTQTPTVLQLLPVQPPAMQETAGGAPQYIFEPDAETIFADLLPRYVETLIYQPLLETVASFYSAQMVAMRNATDNANDLLDDLTLTYNKARQGAITTQILEIVAGSGAL